MESILTVVVTYNGRKWIDRCISSVIASEMPSDIIVIDNGSSDGTPEILKSDYPSVILVQAEENLGFGKANNIGMRYAVENGYDYVYLLNQDAWVMPDTYGKLVAVMEDNQEYGILSPVQMSASLERADRNFAEKCMSPGREYTSGLIYDVDFVMAAHWMMSRRCVMTVGGFSPAFPHYGEDDNYIHRAVYHGFRIGFLAGAVAVHDREQRPYVKEIAMKRKLIAAKVRVSDPNCLFISAILLQPLKLAAMAMYHRSRTVFASVFELIWSYPSLRSYRKKSENVGAFL